MIEVYVDGEWIERQPQHQEKYRKTVNGSVIISYYRDYDIEPEAEENV